MKYLKRLKLPKKITAITIIAILVIGMPIHFVLKSYFNTSLFSQAGKLIDKITLEIYKKNSPNVYLPEYLKYQNIDRKSVV